MTAQSREIKKAAEVVDAQGMAVTPGFIDIHRHCDIQPFYEQISGKSCWRKVITTLAGNWRFSMVPVPEDEEKGRRNVCFCRAVSGTCISGDRYI